MWGCAKALGPLILGLLILGLLVTGICSQIEITPTVPDHATVLVDWKSRTYYSPPYVEEVLTPMDLEPVTLEEAKRASCWPDRDCVAWTGLQGDCDGFTGRSYSLLSWLRARAGVGPPVPLRWNDDGTWNY